MKILVTNDDGINAAGLVCLADAMSKLGEVTVVAPDREMSAVGHALTLHHPLRATCVSDGWFAVDGTPTDCVNLGIHSLLDFKPDLVVSGINRGGNMGDDVTYSGTVAAAMEATLMGIPSIAVSLVTMNDGEYFPVAAGVALRVAGQIMEKGLPPDTFLNLNIPDLPEDELGRITVTTQGKRRYEGTIVDKVDPRGRNYYWIGTADLRFLDIEGSDYHAVSRGNISITPLHLDLTNHASITSISSWFY